MDSEDWNERHRPKTLSEVWGNPNAIDAVRSWAEEWAHRVPEKRALLLYGPAGTGKTSAALALAHDMGWGVVELNASDARNAEAIQSSVALGAVNETFTEDGAFISTKDGGRKLIVIDEADSLYERSRDGGGDEALDRGGKRAILELIAITNQPVVLIVNDLYALTRDRIGKEFKKMTIRVNFKRINANTVFKRLNEIARREGIALEPEAGRSIASRAGGDLRAAVNDLQALAAGRERVVTDDVDSMGARDNEKTIYDLLRTIFGSMSGKAAYQVSMALDEKPDSMLLWVDENLPGAYRNPEDLARAYDCLGRADIYLARASRKNHYRLWPYASYMMTGGVAVSKRARYSSFPRFNFPYWLIAMSRSKTERGIRTSVTTKIGRLTHASRRDVADDILPYVQFIFQRDPEFRKYLSYSLSFTEQEVAFLLDETRDAPALRETLADVKKLVDKHGVPGKDAALFTGTLEPGRKEDWKGEGEGAKDSDGKRGGKEKERKETEGEKKGEEENDPAEAEEEGGGIEGGSGIEDGEDRDEGGKDAQTSLFDYG